MGRVSLGHRQSRVQNDHLRVYYHSGHVSHPIRGRRRHFVVAMQVLVSWRREDEGNLPTVPSVWPRDAIPLRDDGRWFLHPCVDSVGSFHYDVSGEEDPRSPTQQQVCEELC